MCSLTQVPQESEQSRSGPYTNGRGDGTTDQLSDIFDFSKVPDIDAVTRKHMGSKFVCLKNVNISLLVVSKMVCQFV